MLGNMSVTNEESVWEFRCSRFKELFEKHGNGVVIPPCNPWDPICNPLKVFDDTGVECKNAPIHSRENGTSLVVGGKSR